MSLSNVNSANAPANTYRPTELGPELYLQGGLKTNPTLFQGSAFQTIDVKNLTFAEIQYVFNAQGGAYRDLDELRLKDPQKLQELITNDNGKRVKDPGTIVTGARLNAVRNSAEYVEFKKYMQDHNITSKEAFQQAVNNNPNMPQNIKDMFYAYGLRKREVAGQAKRNFNTVMQQLRQPDEEGQRLAKEVEEQADRIAKGPDGGSGEESL